MTAILGISAFYHDSAAALVVDGEIVAAAQEERFTRKKHDPEFPKHAIDFCLEEAGLGPEDLDYVGFYDKPFLKFERLLETLLGLRAGRFWVVLQAIPVWLKQKLHLRREMKRGLDGAYKKRFVFTEHHESHAASAFFPSPFEEAAVLTVDGVGEWATASYGVGRGNRLELTHELHFPHSPGLLYSAFTYFCGFSSQLGRVQVDGAGSLRRAEVRQADLGEVDRSQGRRLVPDGHVVLQLLPGADHDVSKVRHVVRRSTASTGIAFERTRNGHRRFDSGRHRRDPAADGAPRASRDRSEELVSGGRSRFELCGEWPGFYARGRSTICGFNRQLVMAGGALGTALFIWHQLLDNERQSQPTDSQHGSYLGPRNTQAAIQAFLDEVGAQYERIDSEDELCDRVAGLIATENVIGWLQGRMEFGPRALGARSILGDARSTKMQSVMNLKIKFRESFRPFAPSVLEERVDELFETKPRQPSPYMLLVAPVQPSRRTALSDEDAQRAGVDKLKTIRSDIPAITHVDCSARVQTVDEQRHGRYYKLLKSFERQTGSPVIINTSFNVRGEPIVCTPEHAYRCFMATNMDVLVLEQFVLLKEEQPDAKEHEIDEYLAQFQLD